MTEYAPAPIDGDTHAETWALDVTIPPDVAAWHAWITAAQLIVGHDLDGDEVADGYSMDGAHAAWKDGKSPEDYVAPILRRRGVHTSAPDAKPDPINHVALAAEFREGLNFTELHRVPGIVAAKAAMATAHETAALREAIVEFTSVLAPLTRTPSIQVDVDADTVRYFSAGTLTQMVDVPVYTGPMLDEDLYRRRRAPLTDEQLEDVTARRQRVQTFRRKWAAVAEDAKGEASVAEEMGDHAGRRASTDVANTIINMLDELAEALA